MFLRLKKEKGAAAVEFALLLPVLVLIVFGIIQFGPAFLYTISFTQAAREVVRLAAVEETIDTTAILNNIPVFAGHPVSGLNITIDEPIDAIVEPLTATVSAQYDFTIPLMGSWSKNIVCAVTMRQEK